jgi:hypothetical protein
VKTYSPNLRPVQKLDRIEKSVVCERKNWVIEHSSSQSSHFKLNIFYANGFGVDRHTIGQPTAKHLVFRLEIGHLALLRSFPRLSDWP